jgi:predicted nucleotidyltransferase
MAEVPAEIMQFARQFKIAASKKYPVKKAILFGSYAKGNYNENSDIDVCFIIDNCDNNFFALLSLAPFAVDIDCRLEPVVFSVKDYQEENSFGLLREIKAHGIEI